MSVEKRSFPTLIGKTGVMVPATMAWTAIGMKGVEVTAGVDVSAGEGVITKAVALFSVAAAAGVSVIEAGATWGGGVAATAAVAVLDAVEVATGTGPVAGRLRNSKTAATATDRTPTTRDQRARTTYLRRAR